MIDNIIQTIIKLQKKELVTTTESKARFAMETMLKKPYNDDIVVLTGSFEEIYFVGLLDDIVQLSILIHIVTLMGYALVFRTGVSEIYVALFPVGFKEGFYISDDELVVHYNNNIYCPVAYNLKYKSFLSRTDFEKYTTGVTNVIEYAVPLSKRELEIVHEWTREYRWKAKCGAFLLAMGICNGQYFHVFKYIANFC